ncbi:Flp pilus assembly protein CpaB [Thiobacter aerophilum]|uniref:Flp pilus assembly protein CpaB n=1 Tax=Thiobacter aerophilum TaxID=3121275 RepID=A0ABV0EIG0_9BURK
MKLKIQRSWLIFAVAGILGIGAALLAMRYLNQRVAEIEARGKQAVRKVVVAKQDLQKGAALTPETVAVREVPAEWAHSDAITPAQFDRAANAVLAYPAMKGEAILWAQLEGEKAPSFSARLTPGRRAITVPVDEVSSLSGMLQPGDLIDIVVNVRKDNRNITFALLQGVTVLAAGNRVTPGPEGDGARTQSFTTVTLETTPEDAQRIIAAREVGKITALLRAPGDTAEISRSKRDAFALLGLSEQAIETAGGVPVIYGGAGHKLGDVPQLRLGPAGRSAGNGEALADAVRALDMSGGVSPSRHAP